jgi:subtilisin family serine protease
VPDQIGLELSVRGVAQVLVVLAPRDREGQLEARNRIARHFTLSEASPNFALVAASGGRPRTAPRLLHFEHLGVVLGTVDRGGLRALRMDRRRVAAVLAASVLRPIRPVRRTPVSPSQVAGEVTWGIRALEAPALWSAGHAGAGALVAVLDTGADGEHPALSSAIRLHAVFDDLGRPVQSPTRRPRDTDEHGTHTAATIAGRAVAGRSVGVAPAADLAVATVIEGGNVIARVLGGLDWAVEIGARIVSASLGVPGYVTDWLAITRILRARNLLPVFAVGNEGPGSSRSPGNYAEALSVGAMAEDGRVAAFSSSDRFVREQDPRVPDLVAPGVHVISAKPGGGWQAMDGTSMATPHVAGLAALLCGAVPDASADQIEQAIRGSCRGGAPALPPARAGAGLPNAPRALELLRTIRASARPRAGKPRR